MPPLTRIRAKTIEARRASNLGSDSETKCLQPCFRCHKRPYRSRHTAMAQPKSSMEKAPQTASFCISPLNVLGQSAWLCGRTGRPSVSDLLRLIPCTRRIRSSRPVCLRSLKRGNALPTAPRRRSLNASDQIWSPAH